MCSFTKCHDFSGLAVYQEKCCLISLTKQYKFYLIIFVNLVGILIVACICW